VDGRQFRVQISRMAQQRKRWLRWLLLAVAVIAGWQVASRLVDQRSGTERLVNQLWVQRIPTNERDMVWHFLVLDQRGRHFGALGRASRWRVISDGLLWKLQGDQLNIFTPQNRCRTSLKARTWKCAGEAPKPFDLCLELQGRGGKKYQYFSRNDWVIKGTGAVEDPAAAFATPALQSALASAADDGGDLDAAPECATDDGPE
jgi:hypothetical protein